MKTTLHFLNLIRPMLLTFILFLGLRTNILAVPESAIGAAKEPDLVCQSSGNTTLVYNNGGTSVTLSYNGKITFTDDERDIKSISPGGFFKYSKTTFGNKREINIQSGSDGTLTRRYYVGRNEVPYEPEGRQWLQEMLPEIIATSGIGAEERVQRIYARSGARGVLNEINKIESDHAKSIYYGYLLHQPNLKENELKEALARLNQHIASDYEKSKLLRQVGGRCLQNQKTTQQYVDVVTGLSSDYEKGKVLSSVLQSSKLGPNHYQVILPAVGNISSDYEQGKVLRSVLVSPGITPQVHKVVIEQLGNLQSDYEKNKVLVHLIESPAGTNNNFEELLGAIGQINSDYEKAKAVNFLLSKHNLTPQNYLQVFPVVVGINSDYEKSRTLQKIKTTMPAGNAQVKAAYVKAAKTISSDYEYRKVMDGLE